MTTLSQLDNTAPVACTAGPDREDKQERSAVHFLAIWVTVVLVFFSIPRSKLGEYILPGLPPLAILAARGRRLFDQLPASERRLLFRIFAAINIAATLAIAAVILMAPAHGLSRALAGSAIVIAGALLAGGMAPLLLPVGNRSSLTVTLAISVIIGLGAGIDARERVAPMVSYRKLAEVIAPYTKRGCSLMSYRHFEQALPFYTGTRETLVNYRGELAPFGPLQDSNGTAFATLPQLKKKWVSGQCTVLVANRLDLSTLVNQLSPAPVLIGCEGKKLALYNGRVDSPAQTRECLNQATKDGHEAYWSGLAL